MLAARAPAHSGKLAPATLRAGPGRGGSKRAGLTANKAAITATFSQHALADLTTQRHARATPTGAPPSKERTPPTPRSRSVAPVTSQG